MKKLGAEEIDLIRLLQKDIPLVSEPFDAIGEPLGMSGEQVLQKLKGWKEERVVRRYGAAVRHYKLGYQANVLTVWNAPPDRIDDIAAVLATRTEISHIYEREPLAGTNYNLFAMVHGKKREKVEALVREVAVQAECDDYMMLWSTQEFKRDSMYYFVEED